MSIGFMLGDYVAWGRGNMGVIRYFSDDFQVAYVRRATDRRVVAVRVSALVRVKQVAAA